MNETPSNRNTGRKYRLVLFFVIALTAFSSAVREWHQIIQFTEELGEYVSTFTSALVPTASARTPTRVLTKLNNQPQQSDEFRWSGSLPAGKTIEVKGINGDIEAQISSSNQIEVVAHKKSRRGDTSTAQVKVVEHAGGVTICAQYLTDDGSYSPCEVGENSKQPGKRSQVSKNDVSIDFEIRVPQGVNFEARTVNGDINVRSLMSNVVSRTVNGSIEISTTGYADAKTVNGGITAKLGSANWTGPLNFTTVNGGIEVNMPANLSTEVEAQTLNGTIVSDFPLDVQTEKNWKNVRGKIGSGGRELILKTLNGSINLKMS